MAERHPGAAVSRRQASSGEAEAAGAERAPRADAGRRLDDPPLVPTGLGLLRVLALCEERPALMALVGRAAALDRRRLALVERFTEQVIEIHDPDAVETFLRWKADPVIDTILLLTAGLDEEGRYEVLELAEDLRRAAA